MSWVTENDLFEEDVTLSLGRLLCCLLTTVWYFATTTQQLLE